MGNKKSMKARALAAVPDRGNVFGCDPHKKTLTASVLDERGGVLGTETFRMSGDGHRAIEAWALSFGPIIRWGIEGASGLGRHTAMYLIGRGHDVRDVCPTRTAEQSRHRREGSPTPSTRCASPGRPKPTRRCPRRSNAPAVTPDPTRSTSC
jgi:hypothetical protein